MNEKTFPNMRQRCMRREDAEFSDDFIDGNEFVEDTTQYPEFIASFDRWISSEKQKKRASELADMTDENSDA